MFIRQFILIALLFIAQNSFADEAVQPADDLINKNVTAFMNTYNVPGVAVQVFVEGKPHAYFFGYANKEKKLPVSKNTIFEIGAITKIMTSILLAQEIDMANMRLNEPINKYLSLPDKYSKITLQDLATHISGLPQALPASIKDRGAMEKYFQDASLKISPGDEWAYSNVDIGLIGYALETATHKDFNQLYRRHILIPLGMQPIALTVPKAFQRFYAQGYDDSGNPVSPESLGLFPAANGIKATANDMQHFLSAAIGLPNTPSRVFYPIRMTQTAYVKLPDRMQGLGWQIHQLEKANIFNVFKSAPQIAEASTLRVEDVMEQPLYKNDVLLDKAGATNGFRAYIAVIPSKKTGIVILANRSMKNDAISKLGRDILFKLNNLA